MKAVIYNNYGSSEQLKFTEVNKPKPKEDEVLIKVHATAINAADMSLLSGKPFMIRMIAGLTKPKNKILGADIAGEVVEIGNSCSRLKVGDLVFGDLSGEGFGGFAEYVCSTENAVTLKPKDISFVEAAATPMPAVTALQALKNKGNIKAKENILIYGASGGVGTYAVQVAKALDAQVTAVCSKRNVDNALKFGADKVLDYRVDDFTKDEEQYDLIVGANGYNKLKDYKKCLTEKGTYVMTGGDSKQLFECMLFGSLYSKKGGRTLTNLMASPNLEDLEFISTLLKEKKLIANVDKVFSFANVIEAFKYCEDKKNVGKIVITM